MKNKKKLLFVVEAMGGGIFTYIVDLTNGLIDTYDIYVAYAVRPQTPEKFKMYFDERIKLIHVKNFVRSINVIKDIKSMIEIKKIASKIQPDIIHLHSSKAGAIGRWAFNGDKSSLFYTPHGYSFLMANHSPLKRLMYKTIETLSAKRRCTTISCSKGEHEESLRMTNQATYVDNGINRKELDRLLIGVQKEEHQFTVFTLGRICYQKNPILFNKVAKAFPSIHFVWIGDGELKNQLTAPNIEVTGWINREAALHKSVNADVFILTSLWEGLPISLLEAMYLKKPCVVSNVIGNRDVIHNNVNGFVCNTIDDFLDAIKICYSSPKLVDEIVESAWLDIINRYNTTVMTKKYIDIYESK